MVNLMIHNFREPEQRHQTTPPGWLNGSSNELPSDAPIPDAVRPVAPSADLVFHSIILSFYKNEIERNINTNNYHKLQIKVLEKNLQKLPINNDFDFSASDRDANLDIP